VVLITANDPAHPHPPAQAAARRAPPRPRGGYVVRPLAETADLSWAGGAFHARIAFELPESPRASLEVLVGSADGPVAEHAHPTSWEVLLALQSAGTLRVPAQPAPGADGGAGLPTAEHAMATGSVAYVPIGLRHAWQPAGTVPLVAIQAYAPPGPEQRFRALAGMAPVDGGVAAGDAAAR
jgi:mannose-6-phosphate isomerase-like protein (cupin superfamily)